MRSVIAATALLAASSSGCALYNGIFDTCEGAEFTATVNMTIPDNNDSGINSVITPGATGRPNGIGIKLDVDHSFESDLQVRLAHANNVVMLDDIGDTGPFHQWDGADVSGPWTINVADTISADVGYWTDWKLVICGE